METWAASNNCLPNWEDSGTLFTTVSLNLTVIIEIEESSFKPSFIPLPVYSVTST